MYKWNKMGLIFSPQKLYTPEWMSEFAQAPSAIVYESFVRIYFSCRPFPDKNKQYISYSAYVDLNRNNLFEIVDIAKEPILQLGGLGCFDEFGTYPVSVINYKEKLIAYYAGWTRCESVPFNVAIGRAESYDNGKTFIKTAKGPILSYSVNEPFVLSGPKIRRYNDMWYLWYIAGTKWIYDNNKPEPVYKIRMATSSDGVNWQRYNSDIIESRVEVNEAQASPDVFYCNGKYHMFFCYRYSENYRGKEKGYRLGYAFSDDLVNWIRDDKKVGIDVSDDGWDSEMISYPHIFELDNNIYMLYLGNQVGKYGFGLAKLVGKL